jgi:acetylglutamate kinase
LTTTVLKLGGELLEGAAALRQAASTVAAFAARGPVVVVHGGGRAIDAELRARGETPRFVDGLRVTDGAALEAVISVLAGRANTALVAAIGALGPRAVGLTGADAGIGRAVRAEPIRTRTGATIDLGHVGEPAGIDVHLLHDLLGLGYVPVVATVGASVDGSLLNVNADTFAACLAAALDASRLLIAGTTPGVLDASGRTIGVLTPDTIGDLTRSGTVHSGMVATLNACRAAVAAGVEDVRIVSGAAPDPTGAAGTRIVPAGSLDARARGASGDPAGLRVAAAVGAANRGRSGEAGTPVSRSSNQP